LAQLLPGTALTTTRRQGFPEGVEGFGTRRHIVDEHMGTVGRTRTILRQRHIEQPFRPEGRRRSRIQSAPRRFLPESYGPESAPALAAWPCQEAQRALIVKLPKAFPTGCHGWLVHPWLRPRTGKASSGNAPSAVVLPASGCAGWKNYSRPTGRIARGAGRRGRLRAFENHATAEQIAELSIRWNQGEVAREEAMWRPSSIAGPLCRSPLATREVLGPARMRPRDEPQFRDRHRSRSQSRRREHALGPPCSTPRAADERQHFLSGPLTLSREMTHPVYNRPAIRSK